MACKICSLKNSEARKAIESALTEGKGTISSQLLVQIANQYMDCHDDIISLGPTELEIHWKFHMADTYVPVHYAREEGKDSLSEDIGKDEASLLYDLLGTQMSTFNRLTKRINDALDNEEAPLNQMIVNPGTVELYHGIGKSIRSTVAEIRALNIAVNGEKSGSAEGLKALAAAIVQGAGGGVVDASTSEYDDD